MKRTRTFLLYALAAVALLGCVCVWIWVRNSSDAEMNLHYTLVAIELVDTYGSVNYKWPGSWQDLEPYRALRCETDRSGWACNKAELQKRVAITFDDSGRLPEADTMHLRSLIKGATPIYQRPVMTKLAVLRETVEKAAKEAFE